MAGVYRHIDIIAQRRGQCIVGRFRFGYRLSKGRTGRIDAIQLRDQRVRLVLICLRGNQLALTVKGIVALRQAEHGFAVRAAYRYRPAAVAGIGDGVRTKLLFNDQVLAVAVLRRPALKSRRRGFAGVAALADAAVYGRLAAVIQRFVRVCSPLGSARRRKEIRAVHSVYTAAGNDDFAHSAGVVAQRHLVSGDLSQRAAADAGRVLAARGLDHAAGDGDIAARLRAGFISRLSIGAAAADARAVFTALRGHCAAVDGDAAADTHVIAGPCTAAAANACAVARRSRRDSAVVDDDSTSVFICAAADARAAAGSRNRAAGDGDRFIALVSVDAADTGCAGTVQMTGFCDDRTAVNGDAARIVAAADARAAVVDRRRAGRCHLTAIDRDIADIIIFLVICRAVNAARADTGRLAFVVKAMTPCAAANSG